MIISLTTKAISPALGNTGSTVTCAWPTIAGLTIFLLPRLWALTGCATHGSVLISVGGLLLSFIKAGKPLLSRATILKALPGLLLLMTAAYMAGFALA